MRTLVELFEGLAKQPRPDLLRYRPGGEGAHGPDPRGAGSREASGGARSAGTGPAWKDISTGEFIERTRALSRFLLERGVAEGDRVLLLSENRPEWSIADFAILLCGAASVPVYATRRERRNEHMRILLVALMILGVFATYVLTYWLRSGRHL